MDLSVTGRHVDVTPAMKDYAREKVKKCEKFRPEITSAHVVMDVEKKFRHKVEINVTAKRHINVHVEDVSEDMYKSIDNCLDKLSRQMRKHKGKIQHHKLKESEKMERDRSLMGGSEEGLLETETEPISLHREAVARKPMSLDEALLEIKALEDDFLVFFNAETQAPSVLYRITKKRVGYVKDTGKETDKNGKYIAKVGVFSLSGSNNNEDKPKKTGDKELTLEEVSSDEVVKKVNKIKKNHWVFINADTGMLNVLYRRNDGIIGLIE